MLNLKIQRKVPKERKSRSKVLNGPFLPLLRVPDLVQHPESAKNNCPTRKLKPNTQNPDQNQVKN
jgi:hypothetical protein